MSENSPANMNTWPNKKEEFSVDPETLFKIDPEGNFLPQTNIENLKSPWKETVDIIKDVYVEVLGDKIVSIYLSGSVAQGLARENTSDLDMVAFINQDISRDEIKKILKEKGRQALEERQLRVPKLDLNVLPISRIVGENVKTRTQFIVKLLSVPVYGTDYSDELPQFKADKETAGKLTFDLNENIQKAEEELLQTENREEIQKVCKWIMKNIVRQGFCLVVPLENTYTISLETASTLFGKRFPEKADLMKQAFEFCLQPSSDKQEIKKVIDGLGVWLQQKVSELKQ